MNEQLFLLRTAGGLGCPCFCHEAPAPALLREFAKHCVNCHIGARGHDGMVGPLHSYGQPRHTWLWTAVMCTQEEPRSQKHTIHPDAVSVGSCIDACCDDFYCPNCKIEFRVRGSE